VKVYFDQDCRLFNLFFSAGFENIKSWWVLWDAKEYSYDLEIGLYLEKMGAVFLVINDRIYDDARICARIKQFKGSFGHRALLAMNKKKNFSHKVSVAPFDYYIESCRYDCTLKSDAAKYINLVRHGESNGLFISEDVDLRSFVGFLGNAFLGTSSDFGCYLSHATNLMFSIPLTFHSNYKGSIIFGNLTMDEFRDSKIDSPDQFESIMRSYLWGVNKVSILKELSQLLRSP